MQFSHAALSRNDKALIIDVARLVVDARRRSAMFMLENDDVIGKTMFACKTLTLAAMDARTRMRDKEHGYKRAIVGDIYDIEKTCNCAVTMLASSKITLVDFIDTIDDAITTANDKMSAVARSMGMKACIGIDRMAWKIVRVRLSDD